MGKEEKVNPFKIVEEFEQAVAAYTGAPYVVAVNSCTNAIGIVAEYLAESTTNVTVTIPKKTYVGVPMQLKRAGFDIRFQDIDWSGEYQIASFDFWDSARRFRENMWLEDAHVQYDRPPLNRYHRFKCVSFHASKILGHTQGGAILTDNLKFVTIAKEMRFDGRTFTNDAPRLLGRHDYMWPDIAAALLYKLNQLPLYNEDLPNSDYPDLSQMGIFK